MTFLQHGLKAPIAGSCASFATLRPEAELEAGQKCQKKKVCARFARAPPADSMPQFGFPTTLFTIFLTHGASAYACELCRHSILKHDDQKDWSPNRHMVFAVRVYFPEFRNVLSTSNRK